MTWRRLAVVVTATIVLLLPGSVVAMFRSDHPQRAVAPATTCTTFANGAGGGYICLHR